MARRSEYAFPGRHRSQVGEVQKDFSPFVHKFNNGIVEAARVNRTGFINTNEGDQYAVIGDMAIKAKFEGAEIGITLIPQAYFNRDFYKAKSIVMEHTVDAEVEAEKVEEVKDAKPIPETPPKSEPEKAEVKTEETKEAPPKAPPKADTKSVESKVMPSPLKPPRTKVPVNRHKKSTPKKTSIKSKK